MDKQLPSEQEALKLLRKSGCAQNVTRHCKAVARLAVEMAERLRKENMNVDVSLVKIGALLHDIGRSETHSVDHVIAGAEVARSLKLPRQIVSIVERHIGGGITAEEAEDLGWPNKSYMPQTVEEKIVAYADKLIEGTRRVPIERTVQIFERKLGKHHPAVDRLMKLHEEMSSLLGDPS